jgi:site-specific DNA-adenine methylase
MVKIQDTIPLGCMGNKKNELKLLLPIIEPQITTSTIFVEPFCGSSIVSFNVFKQINKNIDFHINDLDPLRINFYKNMTKEEERQKLYKLEKEIVEKGAEFYYSIVRGKDDDYLKYVISKRIHSFRHGLYPTNKNIILHEITDNWKEFFNKSTITNIDYLDILNKYKDNENAFLYLDPPYMDSFNAGYGTYQHKSHDEDLKIIDNTEMYIKFLEVLKNGKCKILFSINDCALTNYLYKDFIKETYNHKYQTSHFNIKNINDGKTKKHTNVLIISNF